MKFLRGIGSAIIRDLRTRLRSLNRPSRKFVAISLSIFLAFGLLSFAPPAKANTCTSPETTVSGARTIVRFITTQVCTFTVPGQVLSIEVLVVGGGGGGGPDGGSGGGGGEVRSGTNIAVSPGLSLSVTVGAGGARGVWGGSASSGSPSRISGTGLNFQANGGILGAGWQSSTGGAGGSGGFGGTGTNGQQGGGGPGGQCNPIGRGTSPTQTLPSSSITGSNRSYGGGGGGGFGANTNNTGDSFYGAPGGGLFNNSGGRGANYKINMFGNAVDGATNGHDGWANTGGGGGGGSACNARGDMGRGYDGVSQRTAGGNGASGVVIVSYQTPSAVSAPNSVSVASAPLALNVTWSAPTKSAGSVTGYQVEHSTTGTASGSWTVASSSIPAGTTSFSITGLSSSTAYYVRVAARYSSVLGPYGYPWTSKYRTTTPTRNGSGNIVYASGSAGQADTNFSRVRYVMGATLNGSVQSVDANFDRAISGTANLNSISNLQVPTPGNRLVVQGNVSDLTVISSSNGLVVDGHGLSGRLELWGWNYGVEPAAGLSSRAPGTYDDSDTHNGNGTYGSFQLHNLESTSKQTVFAWNNHGGTPEIGFGNNLTGGHTDWTFCATSQCPNRTNFSLEIFANDPITPQVGPALTPTFGAVTATPVGYTFQITNYDGAYTWAGTSTANGSVAISGTGLVTVTGLAPSTSSTTTINTTRNGYTSGAANASGTSSGPVLSYNFSDLNSYNSASPGTVTDLSGNSRTGTVTNGSAGATTSWTQTSGSITFPGGSNSTGPFIDVPNLLTTPFNAHGLTVDFEADFGGGTDSYERILDFSEGGSANDNIAVYRLQNSSDLRLSIHNGSNGNYCTFADAISENVLTRYTITANGSTCQLWKNGTSVSSQAFTARVSSGVTWVDNFIGKSNWTADAQYEGSIRSLRLYSGPFNPTQISAFDYKTITYNANGGSSTPASGITSGSIRLPAAINRDGYEFQGWFSGATKRGDASASYTPTATETVQASWNANTNTVTYDSNGGTAVPSGSFTTGGSISVAPTAPTRTGYTFAGWSATDGGTAVNFPYSPPQTTNITLHALWTGNINSVTYDSKGGTAVTSGSFTTGESISEAPTAPTRTGYTFAGWSATDGGAAITFPYSPPQTTSITLFARWTGNTYTITYDFGGATGGATPATSSFTSGGTAITLPSPTKTGLLFKGWYSDVNRTNLVARGGAQYSPAVSGTLYADWTNIVLNLDASSLSSSPSTWSGTLPGAGTETGTITGNTSLATDGSIKSLTFDGSGDGIVFPNSAGRVSGEMTFETWLNPTAFSNPDWQIIATRWFTASGTGSDLDFHFAMKRSGNTVKLNLYTTGSSDIYGSRDFVVSGTGKWYHVGFTIDANNQLQFFVNGQRDGSPVTISRTASSSSTFTVGDVRNSTGFIGKISKLRIYNKALTASEITSSYKSDAATFSHRVITFNANDGTATPGTSTQNVGTSTPTALETSAFTRTGYTLTGWTTGANGTGTSYTPTATITTSTDVNLFAVWTANSNTVTFNSNYTGGPAAATQSITTDTETALRTNTFTRTGYTFFGWNTSADGSGTPYTNSQAVTLSAPLTLFAVWYRISITTQPVGKASGTTLQTQPVVRIEDGNGNTVTSDSSTSVTVAISSGDGGTLGGTQTVTVVNGVATFTNLTLSGTVGTNYILSFASTPSYSDATSQNVTVTPGSISAATSTVTPATATMFADGVSTQKFTVTLKDAQGNTLTTTDDILSFATSNNLGTFGTTINTAPGVYEGVYTSGTSPGTDTITVSANSIALSTQPVITLNPGIPSASTSTVTAASTSLTANGASTSVVTIRLKDSSGNNIPRGGETVLIRVSSGPGTVDSVVDNQNGTYTTIFRSSTTSGTATLVASVGGTDIVDSETITSNPGIASKLAVTVQPSSSNASGAVISTQPRVAIQDANGNIVTGVSATTITAGVIGSGGSVDGTLTANTSSGIATFSGLTLAGLTSNNYVLTFTATGLTGIDSNTISITPGAASTATSTVTASSSSIVADGSTTSTITVQLKDAQGNSLTAGGGTVVVSKQSGGGTVSVTTNNNDGTYSATFTSPTTAGSTVIRATVGGNTITDTESITLRHGVASQLVITQAPVAGASSSLLTTQPQVTLQDVNGNTVTANSVDSVTVAISSGANGNLTGTKTLVLSNGVATFTDLNLAGRTGTNYVLRFESGLFSTTSANIQVAAGAPSTVTSNVSVSNNSLTANGTSTSTITVTLRDSESNQLPSGGQTVALSVTSGFGSIGQVTDNANGTYTATYTSGTVVGTATISATLNTAAISETQTITLVHGPATQVTITQQPVTGASGTNLTIQPKVVLRDANNNIATSDDSSTVTVAITSGSNGSLTGTKTVTVVDGEAVFTDLSFAGIVGTDYKLRFTSGSLTVADSNNMRVTPGVAVVGTSTISASSASIVANGSTTSNITIQLKDAQGNSLTVGGNSVTIRVSSGTGMIGSITDVGNGTYTSTFTSSTTAGTSTLVASVGGNDITATQDISLIPGAATKLGILTEPPNTTSSGTVLATQPRITIQDAFGNTVTSDTGRNVTIVLIGNNGLLSGTLIRPSASGIVTFSGVSLAGLTSETYVLSFSATGLTGVNSQVISMTPGAASTATSTVSASTTSIVADGNTTSEITVTLRDAQSNLLVASGGTVVVSKASGNGTVSATTNNGNGSYTAIFTSPTAVGTTVIQATIGGSTITDTETITLVHGTATQIKITQTPITGANASTFTRQPKVTLFDANDNIVTTNSFGTVGVVLHSGANGTLSGTAEATFVNGVATFTNLAITGRTSTDYVLRFTSSSFTVDSGNLTLTPGTASASTSTIVVSDSTLIANGSTTTTVTVRLKDAQTNALVASGGTVAINVASGDGSMSTVTNNNDGTYTATYTSGTVVGTKAITASVNSATLNDTASVLLVPGPATKILITQQPAGTSSGTALGTQPQVEITDAFNNRVTGDSSTQVTAAISSGTGGTLGGTRTVTASLGVATFTDLTLAGLVSQSYKLTFSSGSLTARESSAISVTPGIAVASTSTISASSTSITANGSTTSVITVQLKDAQGNSLTTSGGTVGMRIASGTGTLDSVSNVGNGTYTSTYTSSQVAGAIEIRASLGGVELTEVQNLTLTPGAATKLAIYQSPVSERSGEVLSTQPKISVQDQYGNIVTTDSGRVVTVAISAGNGGSLDGTLTASTVNGIATFTNVVLAGITTSNYVLSFTTPNLTSVNSGVLTVASGSAQVSTSTFSTSAPSIVANGVTTSSITVTIRDAKENALTASAGTVEMFVTSGHQGSIGTVTDNGNGTYTATYTSGTLVSSTTITAKLNGVALTQTATVSLTAGPATQLSVSTQPVGSASATNLSQQPVIHLLDAFGNHAIHDSSTSVTTAIQSGNGGLLGGTTIVQAVQGVVTFTDLTLAGLVAENYKIRFSSGSLIVADSTNVNVTPGAPSTATSTVSSAVTTLVAEDTNSTIVTIALKDAQGNLLTSGGATVGLTVSPVTSGFNNLGSVGSVTDRNNGTYTATYIAGTKVQSVRFSATLNGNAISDTSQLSLTHGDAYQIAVATDPTGGASGSLLSRQPVVLIQDRHGNTVTSDSGRTVSAELGGFQNTGTLSGSRAAVTSNGQATFAGIVMTGRINTQYLLSFTATGLAGVNSDNFTISQGPTNVTNSAIEADAAAIVANGTSTTEITVSIKDAEGNVVAASAGTVALAIVQGTGTLSPVIDNNDGTYTATFTAGTVSGTARITGTLDNAALGGSASIILTSGPATNSQILVAPETSVSGALLNPQPQIVIKDVFGNTVTSDNSTVVTVSLKSGASGTLSGTLTATASAGIAQFSTVTLAGLVGTGYVLEFDQNTSGVTSIDSSAINLTPGTPTQLQLSTPAATANSGQAFVTQPVLTANDAQGNVATNFTADVTATISGATLQGVTTIPLSSGVATFTDLGMFGTANSSYQVTYTSSSLSLSASQSLLLNPGAAENLQIITQTNTEMNGRVFQTQPVIQIRDAQNNAVVTNTPVNVVATINTGSGTLSGTTSVATNSTGRATFTDLMVTGNTGSYTLTFAAVGLSTDSNSFALTPGDQTITRSTFGSDALPNGTYTPTATAYSGLSVAISVASTSATICSIEDGEVTFLKMGDCVVKYNQSGNDHWSPAPEVTETLTVGRLTQAINFAAIDDQPYGGTDVSLAATAESGLEVVFTATSASSVCVLNTATTVQIVGLGTCTVVAAQAGDEVWAPAANVTRTFVIGTVRPATPTVASVSAGDTQATVSWNPPVHDGGSPITGYRVTSVPDDFTCETNNSTDTSCIVTGLTNGTDYTYVVQAINAIGASLESSESPSVTPATTADAVVGLTLSSTNKKLTAEWIMPEQLGGGNFVRFEMFIRETGGTYGDAFVSNDSSLTSFEFTKTDPNDTTTASDLVNGESYDVKIVIITDAIMAGDQSVTVLAGNSTEATQVPADVPSAPTDATILTTDGTQASISWIASSSDGGAVITAYTVTATANNVAVTCLMQTTLDTNCEITALRPGQTVSVSIQGVNRIGNSVATTASMTLPTPPAPPTINTATAGSGFIQVVWAAPASDGGMALTGYVAKAMARGTNQVVAECTTIGTSCDLIVSGTEFDFDFAVWSMNRVGMSESSNMLSPQRPLASPTPTPTPKRAPATNPDAPIFVWSARNPMYLPSGEQVKLQQGSTMAWRNGEFVEVNLVAAGTSVLQLSAGGGVVLQMQSLHPSGQPMDVSATGMLQVYQNRTIRIAGSGFAPNTFATVWMFSEETKLGEIMTDSSGAFAEVFAIGPSIPLGDHTIQINGEHPDGSVRTVAMGVNVMGEDFAPAEEVTNDFGTTEAAGPSESDSNQALGVIGAVALAFLGGIGVGILTLSQRRRKS